MRCRERVKQVQLGAGTEEGAVHLCSTNMPDHYVESFFGHAGPVYHVAWSPASSETFASASADGTACLWRLHQVEALSMQHLRMIQCMDSTALVPEWWFSSSRAFYRH